VRFRELVSYHFHDPRKICMPIDQGWWLWEGMYGQSPPENSTAQ
jgi:hypothetical protein